MKTSILGHGAVPVLPCERPDDRRLRDLGDLERRVIVYLRLWSTGEAGRVEVWQDVSARLGARAGRLALRRFEALVAAFACLVRHPLEIRPLEATRASEDEVRLARMIAAATSGDGPALARRVREVAPHVAAAIAAKVVEAAPGLSAAPAPFASAASLRAPRMRSLC